MEFLPQHNCQWPTFTLFCESATDAAMIRMIEEGHRQTLEYLTPTSVHGNSSGDGILKPVKGGRRHSHAMTQLHVIIGGVESAADDDQEVRSRKRSGSCPDIASPKYLIGGGGGGIFADHAVFFPAIGEGGEPNSPTAWGEENIEL